MTEFDKLVKVQELAMRAKTCSSEGDYHSAISLYLMAQGLLNEYVDFALVLQGDVNNIIHILKRQTDGQINER